MAASAIRLTQSSAWAVKKPAGPSVDSERARGAIPVRRARNDGDNDWIVGRAARIASLTMNSANAVAGLRRVEGGEETAAIVGIAEHDDDAG